MTWWMAIIATALGRGSGADGASEDLDEEGDEGEGDAEGVRGRQTRGFGPRFSRVKAFRWFLCFSLRRVFCNPSKRHGVEDVGGVAGIGDVDVTAGVNDVGRVFGGPWCSASAATMGRGD